MNKDLTYLVVIIDESGSMDPVQTDTIGGFNGFIAKQKALPGECRVSLTKFSYGVVPVYTDRDIKEVPELNTTTYIPRGGTALYDAMVMTIDGLGKRLALLPEEQRPGRVIVLVQTDGDENSSLYYRNIEDVKSRVEHQTAKYNWDFVFLGADINAFAMGSALGFSTGKTLGYTKGLEASTFEALGTYVMNARSCDAGLLGSNNFSEADRTVTGGHYAPTTTAIPVPTQVNPNP